MNPMFAERLFRSPFILVGDRYRTHQIALVRREYALKALDYLIDHCVDAWGINDCVQVFNYGSVGGR
jgi:hypothetical protein